MNQPLLYLLIGYPGAGKTTVSNFIKEETGAIHIWADAERHKLFSDPIHSETESKELYDKLNLRTEKLLIEGKSVIFDTNFNHKKDRDHLRQIADKCKAKTVLIWVNTPLEVARNRAVESYKARNLYKMTMTEDNFNKIASKLEEPSGEPNLVIFDGSSISKEQVLSNLKLYI